MSDRLVLLVFAVALGVSRGNAGEVSGLRAATPQEWDQLEASTAARINGATAPRVVSSQDIPKPPPAMPVVIGFAGSGGQGVATVRFVDGSIREVVVGDVVRGRSIVTVSASKVVSVGRDGPQTWTGISGAK